MNLDDIYLSINWPTLNATVQLNKELFEEGIKETVGRHGGELCNSTTLNRMNTYLWLWLKDHPEVIQWDINFKFEEK